MSLKTHEMTFSPEIGQERDGYGGRTLAKEIVQRCSLWTRKTRANRASSPREREDHPMPKHGATASGHAVPQGGVASIETGIARAPGQEEGYLARVALRFTDWAEKWFPDAYIFAAIAAIIVACAALLNGAAPTAVAKSFGDGFWSLIPFTMQMAFIVIGGYVVATSPPAMRLIDGLAAFPRTGKGAVVFAALVSLVTSLISWGFCAIFSGLLVRSLAKRSDIRMDYRAAGAAGYVGLGATWALGMSSSAALLQANPGSLPPALLNITGVIPISQTIFLWQSGVVVAALFAVTLAVAFLSAPSDALAMTAKDMAVRFEQPHTEAKVVQRRPGEWLEHSPLIAVLLVLLSLGWLGQEFARQNPISVIANLNTYNFLFLTVGLLLHWRPKKFLAAVAEAVPATTGILIQFPLYGATAAILTAAVGYGGHAVADLIARFFVDVTTANSFPVVMGVYSAILGLFIPSGGGKWIIEAPYVMQAANTLNVNLGWAVQIYNAAEALPNLVNPFWMLPILGVLGLKARDLVGFTFLQLLTHLPVVLFLLWALAGTLTYTPPVFPH
jgi:short-chain fatty acids transporter